MLHFIGKHALGIGLVAACLALAATATGRSPSAPPSPLTRAPVDGVPLSEWTARWWRWAEAQPLPPYLDPDGRLCDLDQHGPVWFLAGTNGQFQPRRECVVPEGRHLLLPIINMLVKENRARADCATLQADAAVNNEHLLSAVVLLDGQPLGDMRVHRVTSDGCFRMDADDASSRLAAADGYWLMLAPLSRGRHTLSVGANYGTGQGGAFSGMQQTFEYVLHVGGQSRQVAVPGPPVPIAAP